MPRYQRRFFLIGLPADEWTQDQKDGLVYAAEDEKIRGKLDRELHQKIAKIADNPMIYSVLAAADQLTENIVSGTRDYIMKKNNSAREVDDQHHRLVEAIINGDAEQAERCMSEHMDTIERYMEEMQKKS